MSSTSLDYRFVRTTGLEDLITNLALATVTNQGPGVNLPFDVLRAIFKIYLDHDCQNSFAFMDICADCAHVTSHKHIPIPHLLSMRFVCKDYSLAIKPFAFQSINLGPRSSLNNDEDKLWMLDSTGGDGGKPLRQCITEVIWTYNMDHTYLYKPKKRTILEAYKTLPSLQYLSVHKRNLPEKCIWTLDAALMSFIGYQLQLSAPTITSIEIDGIYDIPLHSILACTSLQEVTLKNVTMQPEQHYYTPQVDVLVGYNLKSLTWIASIELPTSVLAYLTRNLQSLVISIEEDAAYRSFNLMACYQDLTSPTSWNSLTSLCFKGNMNMFHKLFKVSEASLAGVVLFPNLESLNIYEMSPLTWVPGAGVPYPMAQFEVWPREGDHMTQARNMGFMRLKNLVINQETWTFMTSNRRELRPVKLPSSLFKYLNLQVCESLESLEIHIPALDFTFGSDGKRATLWILERYIDDLSRALRDLGHEYRDSSRKTSLQQITLYATIKTTTYRPLSSNNNPKNYNMMKDYVYGLKDLVESDFIGVKFDFKVKYVPCGWGEIRGVERDPHAFRGLMVRFGASLKVFTVRRGGKEYNEDIPEAVCVALEVIQLGSSMPEYFSVSLSYPFPLLDQPEQPGSDVNADIHTNFTPSLGVSEWRRQANIFSNESNFPNLQTVTIRINFQSPYPIDKSSVLINTFKRLWDEPLSSLMHRSSVVLDLQVEVEQDH
ncbi:hypothetical protein CVT24_009142 [Panaeolus cyanescens]|uniref:Uncharacterized protein n=1 Tax=Panaeolus cyanescens TaxID=181874 RepID=A0A409WCQ7_9AGAR|nr:hypothetical protein CVT24_009142 [Panaeolus cyanescens]